MQTLVVVCSVREVHIPMGEDNLILVQGDRLLISYEPTGKGKRHKVYSVNGYFVGKFYIPGKLIKAITGSNGK